MLTTRGYAVKTATSNFEPFNFERRELGSKDILVEILYCGICHSDIHQVRNEWGISTYPMVPGHEIVGRVKRIGKKVKKFKAGDIAGVGCMVDSCRKCKPCINGDEQFCEKNPSQTYNSTEQDQKTPTYGGYSEQIVIDEKYALKIPAKLKPANAAPLLCAGITTYSPLKRFKVRRGQKVAVVGLGGLGHMAVKIAKAMGAEVTVLSTSPAKEKDAKRLGAKHFVVAKDPKNLESLANYFDFILSTVAAPHTLDRYLNLLKRDGHMVVVGVPAEPLTIEPFSLIMKRRNLTGSLIGGIRETQEMLDFCAKKNIAADVEIIPIQKIEEAYERTNKGDVRYRFVIDMKTL